MGLLDDLKRLHLPPSHLPTINEIQHLLGGVVAFVEHGEDLLEAAENDTKARDAGEPANHVDQLLSPDSPDSGAPPAAGDQARIADLEQQVQTLLANQQRTQATVEPIEPPAPGAPIEPTPEPPAAEPTPPPPAGPGV